MSKCHVRELSNVYRSIFRDARYAFPTLEMEFERDLTRLLSLVEQRGIQVYLVDLPAVGKHLDRCLSGGHYNLSGLPLTKRFSGRVVIPKFLRGLYLMVFHETGRLKDDANTEAIFFLRQILFAAKKADFDCTDEKVENEVLEFLAVDESLPELDEFWSSEPTSSEIVKESDYGGFQKSALYNDRISALPTRKRGQLTIFLAALDFVSGAVTSTLGSYDPGEWSFKHGPGAVSETTGPSNKYYWKNWSDSLESEFPIADYGFHSFASWADRANSLDCVGTQVPQSRLVAVPKTYSKPRLIAAEPSENMWCQQNCWNYFSDRCRDTWIDNFVRFRDQSLNQRLCALGSLDGTLATVDLSAASDRVTCHAVGQLFRSNPKLLRCLRAFRTPWVGQTLTRKVPERIRLRKFSTMGNACTFPVESLLFFCIAAAATLVSRGLWQARQTRKSKRSCMEEVETLVGQVAVFGDDVVIPIDSRELFVEALEVLDFKVNMGKSFWSGNFRESCGVDSFRGVTVTPAYWKTFYDGGPESLASVVEVRNNFYQKFLLNTSTYLASTLPRLLANVAQHSGAFGLKTRLPVANTSLRERYNDHLQRFEIRTLTLIASQSRSPTGSDTALLQFFTEDPGHGIPWTHGVPQRPRLQVKPRWVSIADLAAQA
jgi:hypothetical protein